MIPALTWSQDLVKAEYFFDSDPGYGNGIQLKFASTTNINLSANIYTGLLDPGYHTFYYRFKDNKNGWGTTFNRAIFVSDAKEELAEAEYFFDEDPGFGNGIKLKFEDADNVNLSANIYTGLLKPGFHNFYYRFKSERKWGNTFYQPVFKTESTVIYKIVYSYDEQNTLYELTLIPGSKEVEEDFFFQTEHLESGEHTLHLCAVNNNGMISDTLHIDFLFIADNLPEVNQNNISFGPNPASDVIYFVHSDIIQSIRLLDMNGRIVLERSQKADQLNVSHLSSGNYLVLINTGSGLLIRKLIISKLSD